MNAKKWDKVATATLYTIAGIIVLILASLLVYIFSTWSTACVLALFNW